jgi:hypothetical protein
VVRKNGIWTSLAGLAAGAPHGCSCNVRATIRVLSSHG